ncbi:MAG TPA: DUF1552 domain-containing protein, partial [Steroidobacteraceae bacterium]|nr:DUF1552 domain-containing protein [Steroidobacteraceae bacterium]
MMHFITRKHLSRRFFLRGAGTALALPLLESMTPAFSAEAPRRVRLAAIYCPHGATMDKWTPAGEGRGIAFSEILQPLEPFRRHLNVISGLGLPLAYGDDSSAGANHTRASACFLSAAGPTSAGQPRLGVTLDQLAARHIGQDTPLPSLELSIEDGSLTCGAGLSCAYRNTLSWQSETSPLPMENNPQVVFERLFGDGSDDAQRRQRREFQRSLLDAVSSDLGALEKTLPATDRQRLGAYVEDVREVERRLQRAAERGQSTPQGETRVPAGIPDDPDRHIKLQMDLITLAWQADIARVSTLMLAKEVSNAVYPASGIRDPFHNLSHHSNVRANQERFALLNRYHVSLLGYFLDKLAKARDGEATLLDNSLVLYGSGISDGNQHDHGPLPIVLA